MRIRVQSTVRMYQLRRVRFDDLIKYLLAIYLGIWTRISVQQIKDGPSGGVLDVVVSRSGVWNISFSFVLVRASKCCCREERGE
jgi:hypothetical protein